MRIKQWSFALSPRSRGFHLITDEILRQVDRFGGIQTGICHILLQHTSASLSLNENADPTVRTDMEEIFSRLVPERESYYVHTMEGPDDMPAHAKSSILGASLTIPITQGRFNLGTWQGIYLCEHRNRAGRRRIVVTALGE